MRIILDTLRPALWDYDGHPPSTFLLTIVNKLFIIDQ